MSDVTQEVSAQWILDPGMPASLVNQMLVQFDAPGSPEKRLPDGAYLTFGHVNPPIFSLPPGTQPTAEMVAEMVLPVLPTTRVYVSLDRLKEFVRELDEKITALEASPAS